MKQAHKAAIYFTFSLGIIPALTCMIRFIVLNTDSSQPNLVCESSLPFSTLGSKVLMIVLDILSMLEMATAVAAVSVPGLKPLLDRRAGNRGVTEYSGEMKA
jgi:hypothetical protein